MATKHYINWGTGVLFPNSKKKTDKSPDFFGHICTDGQEFRLAGFKGKSQSGTQYLRLQIGGPYYPQDDSNGEGEGEGKGGDAF